MTVLSEMGAMSGQIFMLVSQLGYLAVFVGGDARQCGLSRAWKGGIAPRGYVEYIIPSDCASEEISPAGWSGLTITVEKVRIGQFLLINNGAQEKMTFLKYCT